MNLYLRHCEEQGEYPDSHDELDSPGQLADSVGQEGMADGQVPLHSEGSDGQHCGVGGGLQCETRQHAEGLAKRVRIAEINYKLLATSLCFCFSTRHLCRQTSFRT